MDISIIVVSWNACSYLDKCLETIYKERMNYKIEVFVVDNNSSDNSQKMVERKYSDVILIRQEDNIGFAKANNIALKKCIGKYIFLINSDVEVLEGCFFELYSFLEKNKRVGMASPKIFSADGSIQRSCMYFPTFWNMFCESFGLYRLSKRGKGLFHGYEFRYLNSDVTQPVDVLNGAFWAIRREAYENVGGLDEQFFMYGEDIDWCKRFYLNGWERYYCHSSRVIHYGGASSSSQPIRFYKEMQKSNLQYWQKHHSGIEILLYRHLILIHHILRIIGYVSIDVIRREKINKDIKIQKNIEGLNVVFAKSNNRILNKKQNDK